MKAMIFGCMALLAMAAGTSAAAQGGEFVGAWRVDLGATASYDVTRTRVDDTTVQRTGTTTIGRGASDMGSLQINADGTYVLRYLEYELIYKTPVIRGTWTPAPPGDPFAALGAIMLSDAKPDPKYPPAERLWYVFRTEDGTVEARYPPYDGFAKIRLSGNAGAAATGRAPRPARPGQAPAATRPAGNMAAAQTPAAPTVATYTPDQVRRALTGKTKAEVFAILGRPVKESYGNYYFNGVENVFPHCPGGCNWKSFMIQFGGPGETANSIELQSWLVD
jgi:hypothetical protein